MSMKPAEFKEELTKILEDVRSSKSSSQTRERALELRISQLKGEVSEKEKELGKLKDELDKAGLRQKYEEELAARRGVVKKAADDIPEAKPTAAPEPAAAPKPSLPAGETATPTTTASVAINPILAILRNMVCPSFQLYGQ